MIQTDTSAKRLSVNIEVEFKDLEPARWWTGFPHTHGARRIQHVVPDAPEDWRYNLDADKIALAQELSGILAKAAEAMVNRAESIRCGYLENQAGKV